MNKYRKLGWLNLLGVVIPCLFMYLELIPIIHPLVGLGIVYWGGIFLLNHLIFNEEFEIKMQCKCDCGHVWITKPKDKIICPKCGKVK